jgi:uncharacterized protein YdbL (DUF1318 family)
MRRILTAIALAVTLLCGTVLPAAARPLEAERAQGFVGDQADGYLGIVSGGTPALQAQVAQINADRAQQYAAIAKQQGTTATAVGAITGQQLYAQTPSGQYFRDASGSWIKKP